MHVTVLCIHLCYIIIIYYFLSLIDVADIVARLLLLGVNVVPKVAFINITVTVIIFYKFNLNLIFMSPPFSMCFKLIAIIKYSLFYIYWDLSVI